MASRKMQQPVKKTKQKNKALTSLLQSSQICSTFSLSAHPFLSRSSEDNWIMVLIIEMLNEPKTQVHCRLH